MQEEDKLPGSPNPVPPLAQGLEWILLQWGGTGGLFWIAARWIVWPEET